MSLQQLRLRQALLIDTAGRMEMSSVLEPGTV